LASVLIGYSEIAQARWAAWLRKQRLETTIPTEFSAVLDYVVAFADPIISNEVRDRWTWDPRQRERLSDRAQALRHDSRGAAAVRRVSQRLPAGIGRCSTELARRRLPSTTSSLRHVDIMD
jgi:hypothetical protein